MFLIQAILCAPAQRVRKVAARTKKPAAVVVETPGQKLFKAMLPATAKVMFIDSVVVDKADFMRVLPLNEESGQLRVANAKADFKNQMTSYQNEFGDRRIVAMGDSAHSALYTETKLGEKWSKPALVTDFDSAHYKLQNYPFLAADGVTLFFSACGSESMGGRDIFMSTFDSDNGHWYKPQNYGLPFNSTANDYLLAIDDLDTLAWLVSDRHQPEGKVCIYTFVPTETRQNFDDDDFDDNEIRPYATIASIKETWKFGNRDAALKRREAMLKRLGASKKSASAMQFVIDDNTVVTSPSQFHYEESRQLYRQAAQLRQTIEKTSAWLDGARTAYHNGDHTQAARILEEEQGLERQKADLHALEKQIRSMEK